MAIRISFISLGCAKNLINSEQMLFLLNEAGFELIGDPEGADAAIVNTCGFIEEAKMEAIDNILSLGEMKKQGKLGKIIVAGCLSQRYQEELLKEMPEIDAIVGVGSFGEIVKVLTDTLGTDNKVSTFGDIDAPVEETERIITTGSSSAYIKIAEGCDNHCAYCVIPSLRGKFRSRPMEKIIEEASTLAESGTKELIIIAQDITRYGTDLYGKMSLAKLLKELSGIDGIEWIRLHYLYPDEFDDELIDVIAGNEKILKYLDIPIQHINDTILKKMNRRGTGKEIRQLFSKLRKKMPELVLRTSIIAGLPGEGEEEFEEICDFLLEAHIERAGVFPYSPEEGTPAAEMERPPEDVARRRAEILMDIQAQEIDRYNMNRIGKPLKVLCEGYDEDRECFFGRSYAESPDIDGVVWIEGKDILTDEFYDIKIIKCVDGEIVGMKL